MVLRDLAQRKPDIAKVVDAVMSEAVGYIQSHDAEAVSYTHLDVYKRQDQSSYLDGLRFLRCACQGNLLTGATVVVWSGFLREAGPALAKLSIPLRLAGVKSFTMFDKPGLPVLEAG